jgi:diamine N-acetyltransferase
VPPGPEARYGVHFLSSGPGVTPPLSPLAPTLGRAELAMAPSSGFSYFRSGPEDALCLSTLATQVFLDTYATNGINADIALEAASVYSRQAFEARLQDQAVEITAVHHSGYVVAFLDVSLQSTCPVPGIVGHEVLRLYVQAPFQRSGLGRALLRKAEARAKDAAASHVWLTAWSGNTAALAFYPAVGYTDVGETQYLIAGKAYENRVFAKPLVARAA